MLTFSKAPPANYCNTGEAEVPRANEWVRRARAKGDGWLGRALRPWVRRRFTCNWPLRRRIDIRRCLYQP